MRRRSVAHYGIKDWMSVAARFALVCLLLPALGACPERRELVVFHAASLRRVLSEAAVAYEQAHPGVRVRLEPSGSLLAIRKVTELGMRADVVMVSDARSLERLGLDAPSLAFATNEIVLAHKDHSRFTDEVDTGNWPGILLREGVRLGRAREDTAPLGYQSRMVFRLAERDGAPGLDRALVARCRPEHVVPDESELLALLESRAVDYAFLYRSTAEDHRLKITPLDPRHGLGHLEHAPGYAEVSLELGTKERPLRLTGEPIVYGLALPSKGPNPEGAQGFVAFLLGPEGRALQARAGLRPLAPARSAGPVPLPPSLRALVDTL